MGERFSAIANAYEVLVMEAKQDLVINREKFDMVSSALEGLVKEAKDETAAQEKFARGGCTDWGYGCGCYETGEACCHHDECRSNNCVPTACKGISCLWMWDFPTGQCA